jgi:uncharacterized membrane protein
VVTSEDGATGRTEARAGVTTPLGRNIATLMQRRAREMAEAPLAERLAAAVAGFLGSLWSVAVHATVFGFWLLANLGLIPGVSPWDPTLVVLGMMASVEAIFLTTFVLINQNRQAQDEEERSELALQIALLDESETSRLVELAVAIAERLDVPVPDRAEVEDLAEQTRPDAVLDEIRRQRPDPL